jgi:hypothetical protein
MRITSTGTHTIRLFLAPSSGTWDVTILSMSAPAFTTDMTGAQATRLSLGAGGTILSIPIGATVATGSPAANSPLVIVCAIKRRT